MTHPLRLLVVNADDFGLTDGVCTGILRAHHSGIVTSTSVLAPAPAFAANAPSLRDSGTAVGLHLCAVGEDPPFLGATEIPSLVDRSGRLPLTWQQFCRRAASGRVDPDDLQREFAAQADAAQGAGLVLGHVDSHQNLHLWPRVSKVVLGLAVSLGIPVVRVTDSTGVHPRSLAVRLLASRLRRRLRARGLAVPDTAAGLDTAGHLDEARLVETITLLGRGSGSADLTVHPGADPDDQRHRYRWGYRWSDELDALCSERAAAAVRAAGFRLGTFAELERPASHA